MMGIAELTQRLAATPSLVPMVERIALAADSPDVAVRYEAATMLADWEEDAKLARETLAKRLSDEKEHPSVRRACAIPWRD